MKLSLNKLLFILIIVLASFLRFYRLDAIPPGLYQDETSIGYSAYSILQTGRDEYGKHYPLYFKSFGDWKLPAYIYIDTIPVALLGPTPFAVRFPSAFFGVLSVAALFFFIRDLTKNSKLALISSLFLAVNPWSLHYNRATFEVSIALFLFIMGGLFLNKFFRERKTGAFFLGTIFFIAGLYSYNLTRLLSPLLFSVIVLANRGQIRKAPRKEAVFTCIVALIALVPFAVSFLGGGGLSSAGGTLIHSSAVVQAPLQEFRAYMISLPHFLSSIFFNRHFLNVWQYISNIASYFSAEFFFIKGSAHGNHGIGNFGLFYIFEFPLIVWGFTQMVKKKAKGTILLIAWGVLVVLVAALTREAPHATRSFFLLVPLTVFSAMGAISLFDSVRKINNKTAKTAVLAAFSLFTVFNLFYYFASYYIRFPLEYAKAWRLHDMELVDYLNSNGNKYEKIIFDENSGFVYTSLLFFSKYPPLQFQETVKRMPDDAEGFSRVKSFGKYEFRDINWEEDTESDSILLITSGDRKPSNRIIVHTIYFPERPEYFAADQKIHKLQLKDEAYVLVEGK